MKSTVAGVSTTCSSIQTRAETYSMPHRLPHSLDWAPHLRTESPAKTRRASEQCLWRRADDDQRAIERRLLPQCAVFRVPFARVDCSTQCGRVLCGLHRLHEAPGRASRSRPGNEQLLRASVVRLVESVSRSEEHTSELQSRF